MVNRTAYDRINTSLQGQVFSAVIDGQFRYFLYWQTVRDLVNKTSYSFRFLDLTTSPTTYRDFSIIKLHDLAEAEVREIKSANPNVGRDLSEFMQTARTSWSNDIGKLVIPEGLDVR
jgi:hypothetical protein